MAARRAPTGFAVMNNPLKILQTFDRHLHAPVELILFGRARVPDIAEIRELFRAAQAKVLEMPEHP